jgi:small subunit ribosomal protein S16
MKRMGRKHRPYFRICATDRHAPRDGRVIEELGTYDPCVPETDARVTLRSDRIDYWLGVGAQPSQAVGVLIKKYGTNGTHIEAQKAAIVRLAQPKVVPEAGVPATSVKSKKSEAEQPAAEQPAAEEPVAESPPEEAAAAEETPSEA